MAKDFLTAVESRRSIYGIGRDSKITKEEVRAILERLIRAVPSAFNSQSARTVLLWGPESDRLWGIVKETLRKIVPPGRFPDTEKKLDGFAAGLGTILFFEEQGIVEGLQKQFPSYRDNFPLWSLQSSGMLQFSVWTALEDAGLGASLQHYNPLIDDEVKATWELPYTWRLLSQMPFGAPLAPAGDKDFAPLDIRLKVF